MTPLRTSLPRRRALKPALAAALRQFRQDEHGALYIFGLMLMTLMLMMGGMALDLMRHEQRRTTLQQTLDRSTLAAASMQQRLVPEDVVRDYFAKAGMTSYLNGVTVTEGLNFRSVNADASADTQPYFMHLVGVDSFNAAADSTAEQRISNVEVSMVLDISGSMNSNNRLVNLRPAAKEFIDTVIGASDPGRVSISLVPYNAQVNLGQALMSQFNVTPLHSNSYCVELPDSAFAATTLSTATAFTHNGHFDPWSGSSTPSNFNCPTGAGLTVTPMNGDAAYLKGRVDLLRPTGYTSIDVGVKWGALLLDASAQPVINGLIGAGQVSSDFADRPLDPVQNSVLKVLVVMSDGENTQEYKLDPAYRSGPSAIYVRTSNQKITLYSDRSSTSNDYYWFSDKKWHNAVDGGTSGSTRLTWQQVWAKWSVNYVAATYYVKALGGSQSGWVSTFTDLISGTKNTRLQQICSAAKAKGVVIFAIGFEAPSGGRTQLRNCATSPENYFDASGVQITTAFRAIASQLSHLRLTQ